MAITLLFGGDLMLGRLVNDAIKEHGVDYPLADIAPKFKSANISIINLECAITSSDKHWSGEPKAFYFGALPDAATVLNNSNIDVVSLANNHILDFDYKGLTETLKFLDQVEIKYTGAGENLNEAKTPAFFEYNNIKFCMMAYCDHQEDFAADEKTPGMNYIDLSQADLAIEILKKDFQIISKKNIDWPILSLHWGANMVLRPTVTMIKIAHAAIDIGYKIIFGHSAHVFHGVEFYNTCPIIYATGDLVDDYAIDPFFRNDLGLLFELFIDKDLISKITLHPIFLEFCHTRFANDDEVELIKERFTSLCAEFSTKVEIDKAGQLIINPMED